MKKSLSYFFIAALAFALAFIFFGKREQIPVAINTTTVIRDTFRDTVPKPYKVVILREVEAKLEQIDSTKDSTALPKDSAIVKIPISQSVYKDSTYRAVISGYSVSLDSIEVFQKTVYSVKQIPVRVTKKFNFGIQGGYGITKNGLSPYLGFGITLNFKF